MTIHLMGWNCNNFFEAQIVKLTGFYRAQRSKKIQWSDLLSVGVIDVYHIRGIRRLRFAAWNGKWE